MKRAILILLSLTFIAGTLEARPRRRRKRTKPPVRKVIPAPARTPARTPRPQILLAYPGDAPEEAELHIHSPIEFKLNTLKGLPSKSNLVLYINDQPMSGRRPNSLRPNKNTVTFQLDRDFILRNFYKTLKRKEAVRFSLGNSRGEILTNEYKFTLVFFNRLLVLTSAGFILILLIFFTILCGRSYLIRDESIHAPADKKPFSLSKTQLAFWVILIVSAYIFLYAVRQEVPNLTQTIFILLGISAATSATARVIDKSAKEKGSASHKNRPSKGLFIDILSDANGISIHRFQNVVFTLVYGFIFVHKVLTGLEMPVFDNTALLLMGLSSGTYTSLKLSENTDKVTKKVTKENNGEDDTKTDYYY